MKTKNKWKNKTALVTGASSGIGEAFTRLLAEGGCNVVATARRKNKLEDLKSELEASNSITIYPVACDLSKPGSAEMLASELDALGIEIDLLVNNAGVGLSGSFANNDPDELAAIIQLNVTSLTELTHIILQGMLERGSGDILLVGSIAAYIPAPTQTAYSGTKAYVHSFGCSLAYELKNTPVNVTVLNPGGTATEWMEAAGFNMDIGTPPGMMQPPKEVAAEGLRAMARGEMFTEPGLTNKAMRHMGAVLPMQLKLFVAHQLQKMIGARD